MKNRSPVRITVISRRGKCGSGHKPGDSWLVEKNFTPGGVCLGAFNSIAPHLRVMQFDGKFPWSKDKDVSTVACPDPENCVVFEVRRLRQGYQSSGGSIEDMEEGI